MKFVPKSKPTGSIPKRGPIAWMACNPVAANLLMIVLMIGGLIAAGQIKQEVFPEFELNRVTVTVTCAGATPQEMEKSVVQAIEEAVQGLDGVKETSAIVSSGRAVVNIDATDDADGNMLLQDVKAAVDRITTFPQEADAPLIALRSMRREVVSVALTGTSDPTVLRYWAELIREELAKDKNITQVELQAIRNHEVVVEVSQDSLRRYGLTLQDVATAIGSSALEQGGGTVRASSGDIMVRVNERRNYADDFANVAIKSNPDGSRLLLDDIATIRDTFDDSTRWAQFNGQDAILINTYRVGDQTPVSVSAATRKIIDQYNATMPGELRLNILNDGADVYKQREDLLISNAITGMVLVFLCLTLFLRPALAFWVALGIPISVLGAFLFFKPLGMSINMMSMFAFIVTLGIVVDDAIVVGENVNSWQERGADPLEAAIRGTREVGMPVVFSILTNMIAFIPILFVPGFMGKIWSALPLVVVAVFTCSLLESLFVLPAHLTHIGMPVSPDHRPTGFHPLMLLEHYQQRFSRGFVRFVEVRFGGLITDVLHHRYVTVAIGVVMILLTIGYVASGRLGFDLMPRTEADFAFASAVVPSGMPRQELFGIRDHLVGKAQEIVDKHGGNKLSQGIYVQMLDTEMLVRVYLVPPDDRPISTEALTNLWRDAVGIIPGVESLSMESDRGGPGAGKALTVRLSHRDTDVLEQAAEELGEVLSTYAGIRDVDSGTSKTTRQFEIRILPVAEQLGLTSREVATQLYNAFAGARALRQQRESNEVTVRVRLPEGERIQEATFEELVLRTPSDQEVLLRDVIKVDDGRADAIIRHTNGRRTATVAANVVPSSATGTMMQTISKEIMPDLIDRYPGLTWEYGGRQSDMQDSTNAMISGLFMAIIGIYALLAIPFKSYTQPLIIMIAIPFGMIGAVLGHIIMGYSLSVISLFGVVALSGVVVNDSLVLIDFANNRQREGLPALEAIRQAAIQRFRPIILTTLTTFAGLAPIIFETSRQAKQLIPVALSLGFGILFATGICLLLVPALYIILDDVHSLFRKPDQSKEQADVS